jgi:hypothetical protein
MHSSREKSARANPAQSHHSPENHTDTRRGHADISTRFDAQVWSDDAHTQEEREQSEREDGHEPGKHTTSVDPTEPRLLLDRSGMRDQLDYRIGREFLGRARASLPAGGTPPRVFAPAPLMVPCHAGDAGVLLLLGPHALVAEGAARVLDADFGTFALHFHSTFPVRPLKPHCELTRPSAKH